MFRGFVGYQVRLLMSPAATHQAMQTPTWQAVAGGMSADDIESFTERRKVIHEAGDAQHLRVLFEDESPQVAMAGVRALMEAYEKLWEAEQAKHDGLTFATTQIAVLTTQLKEGAAEALRLSAQYGGADGLAMTHRDAVAQMLATDADLERVRSELRSAEASHGDAASPRALSPAEIAIESERMADALLQLELMRAKEARLAASGMGDMNPALVVVRQEIDLHEKWVERIAAGWNKQRSADTPLGATTVELVEREKELAESANRLRGNSQALGATIVEIERLRANQEDLGRRLMQMTALKDQVASQFVGQGRISLADTGRLPVVPFKDRRRAFALVGGFLGGLLGLLVIAVIGLRDRRIRSSRDVADSLARVRLLGLIPVLPSTRTAAGESETAAHCVDQIRTWLQIGIAREGPACICVAGPSVGSGKTTVSLALGLSFASASCRTLLVDADLSGRGLTRRTADMSLTCARSSIQRGHLESGADATVGDPQGQLTDAVLPGVGPSVDPAPEELADLLSLAFRSMGADGLRDSGLLAQIFSLDDLLFSGSGRKVLTGRLDDLLRTSAPMGRALEVPSPIVEFGRVQLERDGSVLSRCAYPTGIESLEFLPLRGLGHGGEVSVTTIAELLTRVRQEYDVAIIDTGPVSGSVECSMVAAFSNRVVFVVSPGEDWRDAEKAISQLELVGARVAGVVLNRADVKDVLRENRSHSFVAGKGQAP